MQELAMKPRFMLVGFISALAVLAAAQETPPPTGGTSPLGIRQQRFERMMEDLQRKTKSLIRAERGEKRESDRLANKEKTLADLAAKIKALEAVIREEKAIVEATQAARADAVQRLARIAGDQEQTRQKAEAIANQIAKEAGDERGPFEPKPIPMPATETPPAGAKPNEAPSAPPPAASEAA